MAPSLACVAAGSTAGIVCRLSVNSMSNAKKAARRAAPPYKLRLVLHQKQSLPTNGFSEQL